MTTANRAVCLVGLLGMILAMGCGYGATVEERGFYRHPETLRILNQKLRVYDCAGLPPGARTCQYMRFQVALDEAEPAISHGGATASPPGTEPVAPPPPAGAEHTDAAPADRGAAKQMMQQGLQAPGQAPESPSEDKICSSRPTEVLRLKYEVLKYPSSEVSKHIDDLNLARTLPVSARLKQRPFLSKVGFQPRWSVDSERVDGSKVQLPPRQTLSMDLEICEGKRVANLDLVLLDEDINWGATGDVYQLAVWKECDEAHRTVERLNTIAQWGLGSWLAGVALIGAYIVFGATW
jgi:hypothetical protein